MKYYLCYLLLVFVSIALVMTKYADSNSDDSICNGIIILTSAIAAHFLMKIVKDLMPKKLLQGLDKKAVLITGCDSGFGNLCAKRLDALGVTVYAGCLLPEEPGATQLKASTSSRLHIVPLDVTKEDDAKEAVEYVKKTIGDKNFWCVLNNAGILSDLLLEHNTVEDVRRRMEVNALGVVNVTQKFLPLLKDTSGRVVCTVSVLGRLSLPLLVPYSMSKHALLAYVEGLRRELQHTRSSVTVHGVEPSTYKTNLTDNDFRIASARKQLAESSEIIKQEVRETIIENYKVWFGRLVNFSANYNANEVVDCMIDAAIGAEPKLFYRPNLRCRLEVFLVWCTPTELLDWVLKIAFGILASRIVDSGPQNESQKNLNN